MLGIKDHRADISVFKQIKELESSKQIIQVCASTLHRFCEPRF
jgi:hypothetical protein